MHLMYVGSAACGRKRCISSKLLRLQLLVSNAKCALSELLHLNVLQASTLPQGVPSQCALDLLLMSTETASGYH